MRIVTIGFIIVAPDEYSSSNCKIGLWDEGFLRT